MKDKLRHCSNCKLWGCPKRNYWTDLCEYDIYEVTTALAMTFKGD